MIGNEPAPVIDKTLLREAVFSAFTSKVIPDRPDPFH